MCVCVEDVGTLSECVCVEEMKSAVTSWRGQSMEEEELDRLLEELLEKNKDRLVDAVGSCKRRFI